MNLKINYSLAFALNATIYLHVMSELASPEDEIILHLAPSEGEH
jgi:hypothetical protein